MNNEVTYTLVRFHDTGSATGGILYDNDMNFLCFTVEDQYQEEKVMHETRIPAGVYSVKKRKALSPMTKRYRATRDWFDWHLELQDVPNFEYVYLHNGVDSDSSSACIIVGEGLLDKYPEFQVWNSKVCFERVWKEMSDYLENDYDVYIEIKDESYIKQPF